MFLSVSTEILLDLEAVIDSYDVLADKGITKPGMYVKCESRGNCGSLVPLPAEKVFQPNAPKRKSTQFCDIWIKAKC